MRAREADLTESRSRKANFHGTEAPNYPIHSPPMRIAANIG